MYKTILTILLQLSGCKINCSLCLKSSEFFKKRSIFLLQLIYKCKGNLHPKIKMHRCHIYLCCTYQQNYLGRLHLVKVKMSSERGKKPNPWRTICKEPNKPAQLSCQQNRSLTLTSHHCCRSHNPAQVSCKLKQLFKLWSRTIVELWIIDTLDNCVIFNIFKLSVLVFYPLTTEFPFIE